MSQQLQPFPVSASRVKAFVRIGQIKSEWYQESIDPHSLIAQIGNYGPRLDVLTFIERPPLPSRPSFSYHYVIDHVAAIPISDFETWWEKQVIKKIRKNVRRSQKYGITVEQVPFDDRLVQAIQAIYDEVPLRGGRPCRHYKDDLATCRRKQETFLDRSIFLAAIFRGEIIGFIKMVLAGSTARTMQFVCLERYRGMSPANALLAKAVEIAAEKKLTHLVFGKLQYGNKGSDGLEEFKLANGFERLEFPRYYVPLTGLGYLYVWARLYRSPFDFVPKKVMRQLRQARTSWYNAWHKRRVLSESPCDAAVTDSET